MEPDPIMEKAKQRFASRSQQSGEDLLKAAKDALASWTSYPEGRDLFLSAIRTSALTQGFASELAREAIAKLSPRSRRILSADGILVQRTWHDFWSNVLLGSFALVLISSALALAVRTACFADQKDSSSAQMLLTMFTTSFGFLSGLIIPNSSTPSAAPSRLQNNRMGRNKRKPVEDKK